MQKLLFILNKILTLKCTCQITFVFDVILIYLSLGFVLWLAKIKRFIRFILLKTRNCTTRIGGLKHLGKEETEMVEHLVFEQDNTIDCKNGRLIAKVM